MNWPASVLSRLRNVTQKRDYWTACCPVHEDNTPSMRIKLGDSGVLLLRCYVCKNRFGSKEFLEHVCEATGTEPLDWCRERQGEHSRARVRKGVGPVKILATYDYTDEHGELILQEVRVDGPAKCLVRRPAMPSDPLEKIRTGDDGAWVWERPEHDPRFEKRDILYNVVEMLAEPGQPVCICEGPKDCETLRSLYFVAVTNPFGYAEWHQQHADRLHGRRCVVFEDNDESGRRRTRTVVGTLMLAGAASIRVVRFPELPEHGDVTDWLNLPQHKDLTNDQKRALVANRVKAQRAWIPEAVA
jgi:hypothetical protein